MKIFFILLLLVGTALQAGPELSVPGDLPGERVVSFGEGNSLQQFKNLVIADLPELHTRVIYSRMGMVPPGAKGFYFIYPGTSARVDSEYGIQPSLSPIANELYKRGYGVIAFQPPIYWGAGGTEEERQPFLERYGNLDGNLAWLNETLAYGYRKLAEKGHTPHSLPCYGVMRSTFAAVGLEQVSRATRGIPGNENILLLKKVAALGLFGHSPEEIDHWHQGERVFYFDKFPHKADRPVVLAAPRIFSDMTHQTVLTPGRPGGLLEEVVGTVGSRDEFANGDIAKLMMPLAAFSTNHPDVPVTVAWHDGHHNPASEIRDAQRNRIAGPMSRMKLVLDLMTKPRSAGIVHLPDEASAYEPLSEEQIHRCLQTLAVVGSR